MIFYSLQQYIINNALLTFIADRLMSVVKKKKARDFLEEQIAPFLLVALAQMQQAKPKNPVEWMADWLTLHDPANNE
jgi:hypothetical protein